MEEMKIPILDTRQVNCYNLFEMRLKGALSCSNIYFYVRYYNRDDANQTMHQHIYTSWFTRNHINMILSFNQNRGTSIQHLSIYLFHSNAAPMKGKSKVEPQEKLQKVSVSRLTFAQSPKFGAPKNWNEKYWWDISALAIVRENI